MMPFNHLLERIRAQEPLLRGHGVDRLYIFGSHARGMASDRSDVDVLVRLMPEWRGGYFAMARVKRTLEDKLDMNVDVQLEDSVPPLSRALDEAVRVF
jgi:predicted nucleotidyltransferase